MPLSMFEYFTRKGAVELLCELSQGPMGFDDLRDELFIDSNTLNARITEGQQIELLTIEPDDTDGRRKPNVLTKKGEMVRVLLKAEGVIADYEQYKAARQRFEEKRRMLEDNEFGIVSDPSDEMADKLRRIAFDIPDDLPKDEE